jgi:membrane protein DedA with SNARE-associated domain
MFDLHPLLPLLAILTLAAATLLSEDLTCVGAGVLVAEGALPFPVAVTGCFVGIVGGDVLLMLAGRWLGAAGLRSRVAQRLVSADAIERSEAWMQQKGAIVIALSRFIPGTRLATYVAAGALGISVGRFATYVSLTALLWVPALVATSAFAGAALVAAGLSTAGTWLGRALLLGLVIGGTMLAAKQLSPWKLRRRFYGLWCRWTRWEFWPMWALYLPLLPYLLWLAVKHRGLTVFTAANPDIPSGGFVGESKFDILRSMTDSAEHVARSVLVPAYGSRSRRAAIVRKFMEAARLSYPIVLKPDRGQRGAGVAVVRSQSELIAVLDSTPVDLVAQEYIAGLEFGVFYYRHPSERRGHIFSLTDKRFPMVIGDGHSTLETLILADARAVCLERLHRRVHRSRLASIPKRGEVVRLVEIGSHCRGALFLDGGHLVTGALEQAFDNIAQRFGGFYFGRFDVRTPSVEAFTRHGEFEVMELNGVTSEATHIYDPRHNFLNAYRVLAEQWRIAFEIGAANRQRGVRPTTPGELLRLVLQHRCRRHPTAHTTARGATSAQVAA